MTTDAKESLTALVAVSSFVGLFCFVLWLTPNDPPIPRWVTSVGFVLNLILLVGSIIWRRRRPVDKPE